VLVDEVYMDFLFHSPLSSWNWRPDIAASKRRVSGGVNSQIVAKSCEVG